MAVNKWFEEIFIPSFYDKMHNPKYPNRALLSERQFDIALKYMDVRDYDWYYETDKHTVSVFTQGRYKFISVWRKPYRLPHRISWARYHRQEIFRDGETIF